MMAMMAPLRPRLHQRPHDTEDQRFARVASILRNSSVLSFSYFTSLPFLRLLLCPSDRVDGKSGSINVLAGIFNSVVLGLLTAFWGSRSFDNFSPIMDWVLSSFLRGLYKSWLCEGNSARILAKIIPVTRHVVDTIYYFGGSCLFKSCQNRRHLEVIVPLSLAEILSLHYEGRAFSVKHCKKENLKMYAHPSMSVSEWSVRLYVQAVNETVKTSQTRLRDNSFQSTYTSLYAAFTVWSKPMVLLEPSSVPVFLSTILASQYLVPASSDKGSYSYPFVSANHGLDLCIL